MLLYYLSLSVQPLLLSFVVLILLLLSLWYWPSGRLLWKLQLLEEENKRTCYYPSPTDPSSLSFWFLFFFILYVNTIHKFKDHILRFPDKTGGQINYVSRNVTSWDVSSSWDRDNSLSSPKMSGTVICFAEVYSIHVIFVNCKHTYMFSSYLHYVYFSL